MNEIIERIREERSWTDERSRRAWRRLHWHVNKMAKEQAEIETVRDVFVALMTYDEIKEESKKCFKKHVLLLDVIVEKYPKMIVREFNAAVSSYLCMGTSTGESV